jgi:LytTr DNA-binding domain
MFENLHQPYPFNNHFKHNAKTIGLVGMSFVLLVLYFQPFGINFLKSENDGYFVLGAGVMCVLSLLANNLILPGLMPGTFNTNSWTVLKEIIWNIWLFSNLFVILILMAWNVNQTELEALPVFRTGALALLPLILLNLINYNHTLKAKMVSVLDNSRRHFFGDEKIVPTPNKDFHLLGENRKDHFNAVLADILVFHSSGNYIEIFLIEKGVCRKKLFRQSFVFLEHQLEKNTSFAKCHRCWIVNVHRVETMSGNSKGYFLDLDKLEFKVPISRNFISSFRALTQADS